MKKSVLTISFISLAFYGYSQNEVKPNTELTSPIMQDFLKNYQQENTIKKFQLPPSTLPFTSEFSKRGIEGDKNVKPELENIDNMPIIKPNLVEIMRMPIVRPDGSTHHTMRIVNSDTNKSKPTQ
jgi:hypothetical protein